MLLRKRHNRLVTTNSAVSLELDSIIDSQEVGDEPVSLPIDDSADCRIHECTVVDIEPSRGKADDCRSTHMIRSLSASDYGTLNHDQYPDDSFNKNTHFKGSDVDTDSSSSSCTSDDLRKSTSSPLNHFEHTECSASASVSDNNKKSKSFLMEEDKQCHSQKMPSALKKITIFILAVISVFSVLLVIHFGVGVTCLLQYRRDFGDKAPIPFAPVHGIAVVRNIENDDHNNMTGVVNNGKSQNILGEKSDSDQNYQFNSYSEANREELQRSQQLAPIRILVIGDSIARGVGICKTCYPSFPETIATILSKTNGGRPVYWTAHGKPGATTKWIADEIEKASIHRNNSFEKDSISAHLSLREFYDLSSARIDINIDGHNDRDHLKSIDQSMWIEKLQYHQRLYETNPFSGYDIIIPFAGPNDIKRALVPFLCEDDSNSLRSGNEKSDVKRTKPIEKGFAGDIQRMLDNFIERSGFEEVNNSGVSTTCTEGATEERDNRTEAQTCSFEQKVMRHRQPHVFLPNLPARIVPAKMGWGLRYIAIKSLAALDVIKRRKAKESKHSVYALHEPTSEHAIQFIRQEGDLWDQEMNIIQPNEAVLQLVNVAPTACSERVREMAQFYSTNAAPRENEKYFPMWSPFISSDAIHPNDFGYEMFARIFTKEIAQRVTL
mmetsp:Transcript_5922/g.8697  ORF Transcript_5922/g.8697 Transcript_5922/m.8697 type:complete len:665 (-) Transcript_5922:22-2016(-)